MKASMFLLTLTLSLLTLAPAIAFADSGAPDSVALEIYPPEPGSINGPLRAELYCFNDVDSIVGISAGFRFENEWLHFDSAVSNVDYWDAEFLIDANMGDINDHHTLLYAGIAIQDLKRLPPASSRQKLATYYFTLARWLPGDEVLFDTSDYADAATLLMAYYGGLTITPVWAGGDQPIIITAGAVSERSVWHVNNDARPGGDGSFEYPLATLGEAFALAASGDTVLVSPGHYQGENNRNLNFDQRNLVVRSTEGPAVTILDGEGLSLLFYIPGGQITYPVIDGFTFINGIASIQGAGGAIRCFGAAPVISNCVFSLCKANYGGALYLNGNQYRTPTDPDTAHMASINNCTFVANHARIGSAIYYQYNQIIVDVNNCIFYANKADNGAPVDHDDIHVGGAIASLFATDIFGNLPGDWIGSIGAQLPMNGNFSADPEFCGEGSEKFSLAASSPCAPENHPFGQLIGALPVGCETPGGGDGEVIPTNEWINVYCSDMVIFGGQRLPRGAIIKAFDPDGVLCGLGQLDLLGHLPLFPIYRDDIYTDRDEGASPGDTIRFTFDGQEVNSNPLVIWTVNGESYQVCYFQPTTLEIELKEGWNLISWNRHFEADPNRFLSKISGCIDVVLSFENGGLTWDPELGEYSSLKLLDYHHGYWFKMHCPAKLQIDGPMIDEHEYIHVEEGWNLLAYWPQIEIPTYDAFICAINRVELAIGFEDGALLWTPYTDLFNSLYILRPGYGYWAKMNASFEFVWPGPYRDFLVNFYDGGIDIISFDNQLSGSTDITPSREWMSVYGDHITLDNIELKESTVIEFFTVSDQICGRGVYENHRLIFTPIYGQDEDAPDLYPTTNEQLQIKINGREIAQTITYAEHGDRLRLGKLFSAEGLPETLTLSQNYPNPFNPETVIEFTLPEASHVRLEIFNVLGQQVRMLIDTESQAGKNSATWDGRDDIGQPVASGIYLYRLETDSFTQTKKMILSK